MRTNPFEGQLERLARTLTEQFGVTILCQDDCACTDGKRILLPSLPEPMDDDLERMILGFLDHELGHVAFTNFEVLKEFSAKQPGHESPHSNGKRFSCSFARRESPRMRPIRRRPRRRRSRRAARARPETTWA